MSLLAVLRAVALALLSTVAVAAMAAGERAPAKVEAAMRAQLGPAMQNAEITAVSVTPIAGIYAVELDGTETAFVSADGMYLISGDFYQVMPGKGLVNVTEQGKGAQRSSALAKVWGEREDRYSELRGSLQGRSTARVEMSYIGG